MSTKRLKWFCCWQAEVVILRLKINMILTTHLGAPDDWLAYSLSIWSDSLWHFQKLTLRVPKMQYACDQKGDCGAGMGVWQGQDSVRTLAAAGTTTEQRANMCHRLVSSGITRRMGASTWRATFTMQPVVFANVWLNTFPAWMSDNITDS